jgi:hypothetical protein
MEDSVKKFFKRNAFLKPLCIAAFTLLILTDQQTGITSGLVAAFAVLLFIEGILSLKFTTPSLEKALMKIRKSELPSEEKARREEGLKKANRGLAVCYIAAGVVIPCFWFFVL